MNAFQNAKRIVVKVGTSTLTYASGGLHLKRFEQLVKVLTGMRNEGREVVLVSSGAIAAGMGPLGLTKKPTDIADKQAAAAVGQCALMYLYDKFFSEYGQVVAQVLLTADVVDHPLRCDNVHNTFERLLAMGVLPIVNENDTVAVDEIQFGDNDTLSAIVAKLINADALVLLSDIDGLYDRDPHRYPDAQLIPIVREITPEMRAAAGGSGTDRGTGGMATKICAADICMGVGIPMAILDGVVPERLYDLLEGQSIGTHFLPQGGAKP